MTWSYLKWLINSECCSARANWDKKWLYDENVFEEQIQLRLSINQALKVSTIFTIRKRCFQRSGVCIFTSREQTHCVKFVLQLNSYLKTSATSLCATTRSSKTHRTQCSQIIPNRSFQLLRNNNSFKTSFKRSSVNQEKKPHSNELHFIKLLVLRHNWRWQ